MQIETTALKDEFSRIFGRETGRLHVVRAPGRVNLIGEHTDYNDGFVLPMAIEPQVLIACRARPDGIVRLASTAYPGQVAQFSTQEKIARGEPAWTNYARGVAAQFIGAGIPLSGMDALISNSLPLGGGLSSSAALEVGLARSFLALGGLDMDLSRLALLCQKAEHEYALVPCGIMDQTIVAGGKAGHAMLLDCRDLSRQLVPIDPNELRVVIVNSMVKHELSGSEYSKRRHQCEQAVAYFSAENDNITALRDVTPQQVEASRWSLGGTVYARAKHVTTENERTIEAAKLLGRREYELVGTLMVQSHKSLRDDYKVSSPELDFLVAEAIKVKGVYGARMTGGGFGGCIVALVQPRAVDALAEHMQKVYPPKFNLTPTVFATTATAGANIVE